MTSKVFHFKIDFAFDIGEIVEIDVVFRRYGIRRLKAKVYRHLYANDPEGVLFLVPFYQIEYLPPFPYPLHDSVMSTLVYENQLIAIKP